MRWPSALRRAEHDISAANVAYESKPAQGKEPAHTPNRAAGILFLNDADEVLLCRRTDGEGWSFPGGGVEDGETAEGAARREVLEETKLDYAEPVFHWTRRIKDGVDFTTFVGRIKDSFKPKLNHEHDAARWVKRADAAEFGNLHPGAKLSLERFDWDELTLARAIRDGELTGPHWCKEFLLMPLRITGTGASFRPSKGEFTYRDPANYLTQDFLERCQGLVVLLEHPKGELTSKEFAERVVGTIMLPYIVGNEVWGIAKLYDRPTIDMVLSMDLSTSPAVECAGPRLKLESGDHILIEDKPEFLSHVAIVPDGVWDKGGEPSGIAKTGDPLSADEVKSTGDNPDSTPDAESHKDSASGSDSTVTSSGETEMADKAEEMKKSDASEEHKEMSDGEKLDAIAKHLHKIHDSVNELHAKHAEHEKRLDAIEAEGGDSEEEGEEESMPEHEETVVQDAKKADAKKGDSDEPTEKALTEEREENGLKKNDGKRADSERRADSEKRMDASEEDCDSARHSDSGSVVGKLMRKIADLEKRIPVEISDADRSQFVATQERAERVLQLFGDAAPRNMQGESLLQYRVRLANKVKGHSAQWKDVELSSLPDAALAVAEKQIYADATEVAMHPVAGSGDFLREIKTTDQTGRKISRFVGSETAAWAPFRFPTMRGRINTAVGRR